MICSRWFDLLAITRCRCVLRRAADCVLASVVVSALFLASASVVSAAPSIGNLFPPALQPGATVTVRIDGGDLAANPRLLLQSTSPSNGQTWRHANSVQIDVARCRRRRAFIAAWRPVGRLERFRFRRSLPTVPVQASDADARRAGRRSERR
jgi:hypothetical protein